MSSLLHLFTLFDDDSGVVVTLDPDNAIDYHNLQFNTSTYAGVRLNTNGVQYASTATGTWGSVGVFVTDTTGLYVRATLNSGTLNWTNSGTGTWLTLGVTRSWGILDTTPGAFPLNASVTLEVADDSVGTNILDTETYTLRAWNDNGI